MVYERCRQWRPVHLPVKNPGGDLAVTVEGTDHIHKLFLEGPTEVGRIMER